MQALVLGRSSSHVRSLTTAKGATRTTYLSLHSTPEKPLLNSNQALRWRLFGDLTDAFAIFVLNQIYLTETKKTFLASCYPIILLVV